MEDNKSVIGIILHITSILFPFFIPLLAYAVSENQFIIKNARNILNWQITATIYSIVGFISFLLGADDVTIGGQPVEWAPILPESIAGIFSFIGFALIFVSMVLSLIVYPIYGTITSSTGKAKEYPFTISFLD